MQEQHTKHPFIIRRAFLNGELSPMKRVSRLDFVAGDCNARVSQYASTVATETPSWRLGSDGARQAADTRKTKFIQARPLHGVLFAV